MSNQKRGLTEEELKMMEEMDALFAEMRKHPEITSQPFPERMDEEIWRDIRAYEAEKAKEAENAKKVENAEKTVDVPRLTAEEAELIQLGKIYKKRKKNRKFYVLIAALIGVMLFGMTSIGGAEKGFERFSWMLAGRPQTNIDSESDNIEKTVNVSEEEIYQQIEDEYGFLPVRMTYMPEGIEFVEAKLYKDIQTAKIIYGTQEVYNISYQLNIGYRDSSVGRDIEDKKVAEFLIENEKVTVIVKEYYLEEYKETRWLAEFEYNNVQYFVKGINLSRSEFEMILKNINIF